MALDIELKRDSVSPAALPVSASESANAFDSFAPIRNAAPSPAAAPPTAVNPTTVGVMSEATARKAGPKPPNTAESCEPCWMRAVSGEPPA